MILQLCEDIIAVDKSHGNDRSMTSTFKTPHVTGQDDEFIMKYDHLVQISQNIGALQHISLKGPPPTPDLVVSRHFSSFLV